MSDFTKEELKELMYGLYCRAKLDGSMANKILYEKIQSLIDNYCEHEASGGHYETFRWQLCRKCGTQYK